MKIRIACLVALEGCLAGSAPANAETAATLAADSSTSSLSASEIRAIVRRTHWDLRRRALDLFEHANSVDRERSFATCYGESPATRIAKVSEVRTFLAKYVTGHALQCYQASYFGCTVGEWIGFAGLASLAPEHIAHLESKVVIVERGPNRIVADVSEPVAEYVSREGVLDRRRYAQRLHNDIDEWKGRYTFTRGADGKWLIADRVANYEWECGDGEPELPQIKDAR